MIRFTDDDLAQFAAATGDRNPLHVSADHARRTAWGRPVVFGALGALAVLSRLLPRPGQRVARLEIDFTGAMFTGIDYVIQTIEESGDRAQVALTDGATTLLTVTVDYAAGAPATEHAHAPTFAHTAPLSRNHEEFASTVEVAGTYFPDLDELLAAYPVEPAVALALACSTYVVGMEFPGARALFVRLALDFGERDVPGPVEYSARTSSYDDRFDLLRTAITMTGIAEGELRAFVRRDTPALDLDQLPIGRALDGQVALVTGASRGLGAAITAALVRQGATVYANYLHSTDDARALQRRLAVAPGELHLTQGDARDPVWARGVAAQIDADHGGLDILVCNACPPTLPMTLDDRTLARFRSYIQDSVAMATVPIGALLDGLVRNQGHLVAISSAYVDDAPQGLEHYVRAKRAIETIAAAIAGVSVLVPRPPKLLTDLSNVPMGHTGAQRPEVVASEIIGSLTRAPAALAA